MCWSGVHAVRENRGKKRCRIGATSTAPCGAAAMKHSVPQKDSCWLQPSLSWEAARRPVLQLTAARLGPGPGMGPCGPKQLSRRLVHGALEQVLRPQQRRHLGRLGGTDRPAVPPVQPHQQPHALRLWQGPPRCGIVRGLRDGAESTGGKGAARDDTEQGWRLSKQEGLASLLMRDQLLAARHTAERAFQHGGTLRPRQVRHCGCR